MSTDTQHDHHCKCLEEARANLIRQLEESSNISHSQAEFLVLRYARAYNDYLIAVNQLPDKLSQVLKHRREGHLAESLYTILNLPPKLSFSASLIRKTRANLIDNIEHAIDLLEANRRERSQT